MKDISRTQKLLLTTIFCNTIMGAVNNVSTLADKLRIDQEYVEKTCEELESNTLIVRKEGQYSLTKNGRSKITVVLAGGVFDIIHPGHLFTLSASKKLGDVLVVSVAKDKTVLTRKGPPLNDELKRRQLVDSLKYVDAAILGSEINIFETVERVQPDIIAVGYDQEHDEKYLVEEAKKRNLILDVVRLGSPIPQIKSSSIKKNHEIMDEI